MKWFQVLLVTTVVGIVGVRPARAEHASGGDLPLLAAFIALTGSAVYDIVDARDSARRYNERALTVQPMVDIRSRSYGVTVAYSFGGGRRRPAGPSSRAASFAGTAVFDDAPVPSGRRHSKSPGAALALSLGATVVPVTVGIALAAGRDEGSGFWLISSGMILGPATGHWYAGQGGRGAAGVGLRLGLGLGMVKLYSCCT